MKKFFFALSTVLLATVAVAQSGLTCEDAIPVDENYEGRVNGACELWYKANTYDLPLHVYFIPDSENSTWGPEVEIDFTCVPGVYDDPKLDSLVNMVEDFSVSFPIELMTEPSTLNGRNIWDLEVAKSYREQLADFGVTYPVEAFVKVRFFEAGTITMTPDTSFSSCMDNAHYVVLGDTIDVAANDAERSFVFPYTEWQEDSIRFVWIGAEPAEVFVAVQECDFTPVVNNVYVWDNFSITQDVPHKLYSEGMKADIREQKEGGLYYAKVVTPSAGKLVVEKIPMSAIEGGAQVLEYGQTIAISQLSEQLYCFPKTWTATEFVAPTTEAVQLFVSTAADFSATTDDPNVLKVYELDILAGQRVLQMSSKEMSVLTTRATSDYIYVRMLSAEPTMLTVNAWEVSACTDKSSLIKANKEQSVGSKSYQNIYRLRYEEFVGYPIVITWSGNSTLPLFLAEDCNLDLSTEADNLLLNPAPSIPRKGSLTVEADVVNSWASRIDEEGFMYVCFNPNNSGRVVFVSERPVLETIYTDFSATVCFGETYDWNGATYAETGLYSQTFVAANGADSIVTLNLTILAEVPLTEETAIVCHGESFDWQGTTYTESGEYSVTLKNVNGCDSVVLLHLHVLSAVAPTSEEVTVTYGETYEWHGVTYTESGEYTITLQDENGCDYQATLHLTVLPNPEKTDLQPTDMMPLSLQDAFKVMTMEQGLWSAQDVKLHWDGVSPLHVFVAKQKVYALTPYNRHVLHYEMIPAGADWTLSKDMMAAWESYIAEGVLYVRFLTELPGTLTTTVSE